MRVYRTIPLHFPKGSKEDKLGKKWRGDLNYSVRTKSDINIDALPTKEGPYYGVVLFRPWDERFSKMKTGKDKCPKRGYVTISFQGFSSPLIMEY